jgi:gliding motility-associated lipoprotein GldD
VLISCQDDSYAPKPIGYPRVELPGAGYQPIPDSFPFEAQIAKSSIARKKPSGPNDYFLDIDYPTINGKIHLSYKTFQGKSELQKMMNDAYMFTSKHQQRANGIQENIIHNEKNNVHGLLFTVSGNAASPIQFWVTDSTQNFLRGALYFYAEPNADSIKPYSQFITKDILEMIGTLKWKTHR